MDRQKIIEISRKFGISTNIYTEDMYVEPEINEDNEYTINDCMLIRTTDIFPKDKIIQTPLNGGALEERQSDYFSDILYDILSEKYSDRGINEESQKKFSEEYDAFNIYSKLTRSTIHFTLNGLVESHSYGNFSNRPYIILEPLRTHILDKSLSGLRVNDTFFNDDLILSEKSIILIPYTIFEQTINNEEYLETLKQFNVVVFDGNEEHVVRYVLNQMGYDSFLVNNHGYVDSAQGQKMIKCVEKFANENNIYTGTHWESEVRKEDNDKRFKMMEESEKQHLYYILDNCEVEELLKEKIKYYCENNITYYLQEELKNLIEIIGLEQLKNLTREYNLKFVEENNLMKGVKK